MNPIRHALGGLVLLLTLGWQPSLALGEQAQGSSGLRRPACEPGATLATGRADPAVFSREVSRGVQAYWCETYDNGGNSLRSGPYWDVHPDGSLRTRARYVDSQLEGPVEVFDEGGALWLRGELSHGQWTGAFELFHPNGSRWLSARFTDGRLEGPVETWFSDGGLESQTAFQQGREDGIASSYYPASVGGGLRSRVRVEGDEIVGRRGAGSPDRPTSGDRPDSAPVPMPIARVDGLEALEARIAFDGSREAPHADASPIGPTPRVKAVRHDEGGAIATEANAD